MTVIREPAVSGMFYPAGAHELEESVRRMLDEAAGSLPADAPAPKAIIAPHAGYVYSGPVAATAYARILPARDVIKRVVLLGPCHRVPVRGLALSSADSFATPLGLVPLDRDAQRRIAHLSQVQVMDATHAMEHSLEVHLPFLQVLLDDFVLVPMVVGQATPGEVADVLDALWGGPETLIVISSDLSHYLDYDSARQLDAVTRDAIEKLDADAIRDDQACGRIPIKGMLTQARRRGLKVGTVDFRNSGDTAGPRNQVVGYGSWVFTEPAPGAATADPGDDPQAVLEAFARDTHALIERHGPTLLHLAAGSIEHALATGRALPVTPGDHAPELRADGAAFVTLHRHGQLRGCVGSLQAWRPLVMDVAENAFKAGFEDPRFGPLGRDEIADLDIHISILSPAAEMKPADEADLLAQLRPGIDGLIIQDGRRRALFLPSVWEQLPDPRRFLTHLKHKAGLTPDHWSAGFRAWRFVTEGIGLDDLDHPRAVWTHYHTGG